VNGQIRVFGNMARIMPSNKRARLQEASFNPSPTSVCQLYTCQRPFEEKRTKGRKQLFCSIACRVKFFQMARIVGAAILKKTLTDPEAENYVRTLLTELPG